MKIDFSFISRYCQISQNGLNNPLYEINGKDLKQKEKLTTFLTDVKTIYDATDLLLPASFTGMILFELVTAQIVILSKYKHILDLQPDSFSLQLGLYNDVYPILHIKIHELAYIEQQTLATDYFSSFLSTFFITPVNDITAIAQVKPALIYNQLGSKICSLQETFLSSETDDTISKAFLRVLESFPPDIFPTRKNPLDYTPIYIYNPYEAGKQTMIRSSCCMFFAKKNGSRCYNCPSLSTNEREEIVKK